MGFDRSTLPFLITRETRVKLADINPLYADDYYQDRLTRLVVEDRYASGSFPIPSRSHSPAITPSIGFDGEAIIFPHPGEFYFYGKQGTFKFLILPPMATDRDVILLTAQFVARNSVHSLADHWLSMTDRDCPFNARFLAQKFFNSDQPLQLYCGEITPFLAALLNQLGIISRQVNLFDAGGDGHVVLEAFDPAEGRWLMMDTDYGVHVKGDHDDHILSVAEFVEHIAEGRLVTVVDVAQKHWLSRDYAVPSGFFGQKTWHPDCDSDFSPADPDFYLGLWRKWTRMVHYNFFFSPDGWCVSYHSKESHPDPTVSNYVSVIPARYRSDFKVFGRIYLERCPVCGGEEHPPVWQIPQTRLRTPAMLSAPGEGYDNAQIVHLPLLNTPQEIFRFELCETCGAIFMNPRIDATAGYASDLSKTQWVQEIGIEGWRHVAARYMRLAPDNTRVVLDAACGVGAIVANALKAKPGLRGIALDISRSAIDFARTKLALEGYLVDLDIDDLDSIMKPESVDFVIFNEAYEHMRTPTSVLKKLIRTLRPGGRIRFSAPSYGPHVNAPIRPSVPTMVGDSTIEWTVRETKTRVIDIERSSMLYVTLEKL